MRSSTINLHLSAKILFLTLLMAACSRAANPGEGNQPQTAPATRSAVTDLETHLKTLPVAETSVSKATAWFHEHFDKNNKPTNDSALISLLLFHRLVGDSLTAQLLADPGMEAMKEEPADYPAAVKKRAAELAKCGFSIETGMGAFAVSQQPGYFEKEFGTYLSTAMQDYLKQSQKEQNEIWAKDGGLMISLQELADRAVWWEKFNTQHPDFQLAAENKALQNTYFSLLLDGFNGTPAFDYETNTLTPDFRKMYQYIRSAYPGTQTEKTIGEFQALLSGSGFKRTEKVEKFIARYAAQ